MVYAIYFLLALVTFFFFSIGFGRGSKKPQAQTFLVILGLGLLGIAFLFGGWRLGLLAIAITWISTFITRPLAARFTSKLLSTVSGEQGRYVGLPPKPLAEISKRLAESLSLYEKPGVKDFILAGELEEVALNDLLDYCEQQPSVQDLLQEFNATRLDLKTFYERLIQARLGQWVCGHWVAASSLVYPESLRYLLLRAELIQEDKSLFQIAGDLLFHFERGSQLDS